jgi:hypothetical protein
MSTFLSSTEDSSLRALASVFSIICFLAPATTQQGNASSKDRLGFYDDPVGYHLLSMMLEKETKKSSDQLVRIYRRTDSKLLVWLERHPVPKEFSGAVEDLKQRAKVQMRFREQRFSLSHRYKLVDYDGPPEPANYVPLADGTVPPPSEADLDNEISSGVLSVSAVGFDQTKTHAIAAVDFVCGTLCGGGRFYFLERQEAGWQVKDVGGDWVH